MKTIRLVLNGVVALAMVAVVPVMAESGDVEGKTFMWRLGDGEDCSYLLGSIHVANEGIYPLAPALDDAFAACSTLVVEADPEALDPRAMQKLIMDHAFDATGPALSEKLGPELTEALGKACERHGMDPVRYERLKPWYAAQVVSLLELARLGIDPFKGIDLYFLTQARGAKPIRELEGIGAQLQFLDALTDEEQRLMMEYTLRDFENLESVLDELIAAWESGDAQKLESLLTGYMSDSKGLEEAFDKLLVQRNGPMAKTIQELLSTGERCFVVVGAGHLVGERGLVALLEEAGLSVTQCGTRLPVAAALVE